MKRSEITFVLAITVTDDGEIPLYKSLLGGGSFRVAISNKDNKSTVYS